MKRKHGVLALLALGAVGLAVWGATAAAAPK